MTITQSQLTVQERYQGCLLGLAVGDAVGTTLEFKARGSFDPIDDMVGGGPFGLEPGQWTDDTSMALCLAHSFVHNNGFSAKDQMERYCRWWQSGYMSSTGGCFDIGMTVRSALRRYLNSKEPYQGSVDPLSAGNGSLMRLAPVVMFYYPHLASVIEYAGDSSRTTHGAEECIDACRYFASLLSGAFDGLSKQDILTLKCYEPTTDKVRAISENNYRQKSASDIKGSGYVIDCLEAALWCFAHTNSFEQAILNAANLGDDADTTAAVCGQIAGAYYGIKGIKSGWLDKLYQRDEIIDIALKLYTSNKA